ncbi:Nudix hydrolase 20, chloroplastic-like protein [Drosera capensis]
MRAHPSHSTAVAASKLKLSSPFKSRFLQTPFPTPPNSHRPFFTLSTLSHPLTVRCFTWDDILKFIRHRGKDDDGGDEGSKGLSGYFERVADCNRNVEKVREFVPFVVEEKIVGYVHYGFADILREYRDVFLFAQGGTSNDGPLGRHVTLQPTLGTYQDRTSAVGDVIRSLGEDVIPGVRNELYPVTASFGSQVFFSLERAAAPHFGIKAYGVHMNGYVAMNEEQSLWVGKRSQMKQTFPGMLDHLVAGGLPHGIPCGENMIKECEEEAGIPNHIAKRAKPVGAISYMDIDGRRFKRDVLFCYDLKLPVDFVPYNQDGEVDSFRLIPMLDVAKIVGETRFFKPNCSLVIIDFLFRHGYIQPEDAGYLKLLQSLRSGDCS